jgi:hypothetical protein
MGYSFCYRSAVSNNSKKLGFDIQRVAGEMFARDDGSRLTPITTSVDSFLIHSHIHSFVVEVTSSCLVG